MVKTSEDKGNLTHLTTTPSIVGRMSLLMTMKEKEEEERRRRRKVREEGRVQEKGKKDCSCR